MPIVTIQMVGSMQPSNHYLNNFVAHKISSLTECGAPELSMESSWLNTFIHNSAYTMKLPAKERAYLFNFIRRAEGACSAYREARQALTDYVTTPANAISPYFRSLLNFEICVSQCWQGFELMATAVGEKKLYFKKCDKSGMQRLHGLYIDAKHMDERIYKKELPEEATASIWITNQGLESTQAPSGLSFVELAEILTAMGGYADQASRPATPNPDAPAG
jgi:hypothetical protein